MSRNLTIPGGLVAAAVLVAACGTGSTNGQTAATPSPSAVASVDEEPADGTPALVLDYTAFIPGAVQPSGLGVDTDNALAAIVTDFERVLVVDLATQAVTSEFDVGRNELPRQGATEAVAFLDGEQLAVLYPDDRIIGLFELDGTRAGEVTVSTSGTVDGALTVLEGQLVVVVRDVGGAGVLRIDPATAQATELRLDGADEPFEGLSPAGDGPGLIAVTGGRNLFRIDLRDGAATLVGTVAEVGDPSGVEAFLDEAEGELQIAVTDDADAYNTEPSPLRLYLG